jgi:crotonobetainyl-CoA:carnitine CoA-transferase CaiB-like acyl-CoA transferase
MVKVLQGYRVLEVAQFTFVPSCGGLLADWGADVIKIEHPVRGDAQRGYLYWSGEEVDPLHNPMLEHSNRGKRSVGLDLASPEGQELLYESKARHRCRAPARSQPQYNLCAWQRLWRQGP